MKNSFTKLSWMIAALMLAVFSPAVAHAQAETGAQEHPTTNMAPITAPVEKTDFKGQVSLPFQAQCHGHKIAPGEYTLTVKTVGEDKMVTLQREGSDVVLKSRPITPTSVPDEGHSVLMVRHGPGPSSHTLEGVYVESLKVTLVLDESGKSGRLDKMFAGLKRIPIS
ncbi:MAG: hypothetical protein WB780_05395 [Candidatus Acidiferrales bacterium]